MSVKSSDELRKVSVEEIVAFIQQRGHRVIQTASCWWYNEYKGRVLSSFPYHRLVMPSTEEISRIFRTDPKIWAIRFLAPLDGTGKKSYLLVCRSPYDWPQLHQKSRNQTRRGLERCHVRPLSWEQVCSMGWAAHRDTLRRHGVKNERITSLGIDEGLRECSAYEVWGVLVNDDLAAYIVTLWIEDWIHILIHRSANTYLKDNPNNALVFTTVKQLLSRPGVSTVSYGLESLEATESLEHFKLRMGFVKETVCQRIVLNPWLKPLFNPAVCAVIEKLTTIRPGNRRLQRLAGFCRIIRES